MQLSSQLIGLVGAGGVAHPTDALGQSVLRGIVVGQKVIAKAHHAVGAGASAAAGDGNLGFKAAAAQRAGAGGNAVFANGHGGQGRK